jgi:hypothetical protein
VATFASHAAVDQWKVAVFSWLLRVLRLKGQGKRSAIYGRDPDPRSGGGADELSPLYKEVRGAVGSF